MQLIYDTLVVKNNRFEFVPSLAERVEESADHQTFTFHLRQGVYFHNGKPLTSADVKYTFESIKEPATKSPIRGTVAKIDSIDAPDQQTVVFHASEQFDFIGSLPAIGIIPEGAGTEQTAAPVGSGGVGLEADVAAADLAGFILVEGLFDLATGRPLAGPPRRPLSRVRLELRGTELFAVGVEERTV